MSPLSETQKAAISQALHLRGDVNRFHETWPTMNAVDQPTPTFTWAQLERQLSSLATPLSAGLAQELVGATRKQARFKPPEMVLREILCIASALMDDAFLADSSASASGEAPMT